MDGTSEVVTGGHHKSRRERWRQATGESEVPELQSAEKSGQQRDRETERLGEVKAGEGGLLAHMPTHS